MTHQQSIRERIDELEIIVHDKRMFYKGPIRVMPTPTKNKDK